MWVEKFNNKNSIKIYFSYIKSIMLINYYNRLFWNSYYIPTLIFLLQLLFALNTSLKLYYNCNIWQNYMWAIPKMYPYLLYYLGIKLVNLIPLVR